MDYSSKRFRSFALPTLVAVSSLMSGCYTTEYVRGVENSVHHLATAPYSSPKSDHHNKKVNGKVIEVTNSDIGIPRCNLVYKTEDGSIETAICAGNDAKHLEHIKKGDNVEINVPWGTYETGYLISSRDIRINDKPAGKPFAFVRDIVNDVIR